MPASICDKVIDYLVRNRVSTTEVADALGKTGVVPDLMPINSLNNDLFRTVTTRSDDAVTTQTFEYTRQTVAHDAEIATPLIITRTTRSDERESVCRFEIQFRRFDLQN